MKKHIQFLILLSVITLSTPVISQNNQFQDTAHFKCIYQFEHLSDIIKMETGRKDLYVLLIGDNVSKGFSYQTFYVDSLLSTSSGQQWITKTIQNATKLPMNVMKEQISVVQRSGFFPAYLFKKYKDENILVLDNISTHHFTYEDELKPQDWIILEDTVNILGYACQKAKCHWRGRDWEAWFAPDIPIDEGPWKFYGLPGLIMKLEDSQSHYSFKMTSLQQVNEPIYMNMNKNARKINRLSFLRLKMKQTGTDLAAIDLAKVGISSYGSEEIHYDYIERDYR